MDFISSFPKCTRRRKEDVLWSHKPAILARYMHLPSRSFPNICMVRAVYVDLQWTQVKCILAYKIVFLHKIEQNTATIHTQLSVAR